MPTRSLFPTFVYDAALEPRGSAALNARLLREIAHLQADDTGGQRWSKVNYRGGFTSYSSANRMHELSPTFALLEQKLKRHVTRFCRSVGFDLAARPLSMTDCWVNVMPKGVVHGLHLHPLSTLSGTYYVQTPKGCPGIKFEDPRLDRMMAAPPRRKTARADHGSWVVLPAVAGRLVMFESWLRHEVAQNPVRGERISISFNYSWF